MEPIPPQPPVAGAEAPVAGLEGSNLMNSAPEPIRNLLGEVVKSNPYFAAGGGLMLLGSALAIARKGIIQGSSFMYRQMLAELEITSRDQSYTWFLEWVAQNPHRLSRKFGVETEYVVHDNGSASTKFSMVPGTGNHIIKYKGAYLFINRERSERIMDLNNGSPFEMVKVTTLYRDRNLFREMLSDARDLALKASQGKTVMYLSRGHEWRQFGQPRKKRSLDSVVLDKSVKEKIVGDVEEFLASSKWYYDRGIPYRRGYLLYGPPGSGKSSFIQALAGHLNYNICILNLSENHLTDDRLNHLMNHVPPRSILLLEDIDAAFNQREQTEEGGYASRVTFSGLLNALDGVASAEEAITFMTTNHPEKLDPALMRPGRIDFKECLNYATDYQIKEMFIRFYGETHSALGEEFLKAVRAVGQQVSPAELQGLFSMNKKDPKEAIQMVRYLARS